MAQPATKADISRLERSIERTSYILTMRLMWMVLAAVVILVLFR